VPLMSAENEIVIPAKAEIQAAINSEFPPPRE
jgi:hypothetical protein